jgi:hypothetical protein
MKGFGQNRVIHFGRGIPGSLMPHIDCRKTAGYGGHRSRLSFVVRLCEVSNIEGNRLRGGGQEGQAVPPAPLFEVSPVGGIGPPGCRRLGGTDACGHLLGGLIERIAAILAQPLETAQ